MTKVICNTKFKIDPFADGGSKRSAQIREILSSSSVHYIDDHFDIPRGASLSLMCHWALRAMVFINKFFPKSQIKSLKHYINLIKYYALRIPIIYDKYLNTDSVFCWEDTTNTDIVYLLKSTKCRIIGLPHNIESLVISYSSKSFNTEMNALRQCDIVYTISREESWLLRVMGINAHYLPYYPPKEVDDFLKSIRNQRINRNVDICMRYLLLGSATNLPTKKGMQDLINQFPPVSAYKIIVAGFGTESLNCHGKNIELLGTVSNQILKELLTEIDAILIFQPPTTGALTRIPEMLIAGIPIYANEDAARNYPNTDGVTIYHSFSELINLLETYSPNLPLCPCKPIREYEELIYSIN